MAIQEYIDQKKELYNRFLNTIENEKDDCQDFLDFIQRNETLKTRSEIRSLLHLILNISNNHHRDVYFFNKIEKILKSLVNEIKQTFSNSEIIDIFHKSKRILLFLIENDIISVDEYLLNYLFQPNKTQYCHFLFEKIKFKIDENKRQIIEKEISKIGLNIFENFEEKCRIGENDLYICNLIRNDEVEEFITYITQKNLSLSVKINKSIFETNSFLLDKEPSLIEYAAFFGSIQIFQYLQLNKVDLSSSLWLYAIHGKNPEIIHLLEENHVEPIDKSYKECFREAVKCHHNDIAIYIKDNLIDDDIYSDENINSDCLHYYNYYFFPNDLKNEFVACFLCKYDYFTLVKLLYNTHEIDFNEKKNCNVHYYFFFIYQP